MSEATPLERLQRWFAAQCNGTWEHEWGVKIETLDNPGWLVRIDLAGTPWAAKEFPRRKEGINDAGHPVAERWIHCFTQDQLFLGACDAHQLGRVIELFLAWVDDAPPTA
ncbi:MAG TPA: immunity 53 family protein [Elusimicrobiota bacterium]|nr:immunity 53 family protein [Elusimicrobiota bacterium]HMX43359.1 immunity 53 family protein [Elusimicrobiota bacterium]HMX95536.1 immunity 53 family protein [Elusimicrobiota bacterium]HMZ26173.1 immunity 53 family protein [Elusimicrobiota bacterium]HNA60353.1 immunity 53 family protein [Elusimicrobiota bacterium]